MNHFIPIWYSNIITSWENSIIKYGDEIFKLGPNKITTVGFWYEYEQQLRPRPT